MISLIEAKRKSEDVRRDAQALLSAFKIPEMLGKFGTVFLTGSFMHGTMLKPDIDVHVYNDDILFEPIADFLRGLISRPEVRRLTFNNRMNKGRDSEKYGIYLKVKYLFNDRNWNVDIHFVLDKYRHILEAHEKEWAELSQEKKDLIILLKAQLAEQNLYPASPLNKNSFYSKEIFDAVRNDGVQKIEDLSDWRKTHPFPEAHFE